MMGNPNRALLSRVRRWALGLITVTLAGAMAWVAPAAFAASSTPARALTDLATRSERATIAPDGSGSVPAYRTGGSATLVCTSDLADFTRRISTFPADLVTANMDLWNQCQASGYHDLQAAVNKASAGATIKVLPGLYFEQPSLAEPSADCAKLPHEALTYEQQSACPNNQNLVAIIGKANLQIEGTGAKPDDVVFDAQFRRANAIRADRSPGLYLRNLAAEHAAGPAIDVVETDGFALDRVVGRHNDTFGLLALAGDHGLISDCEAYGNGDAGVAAMESANINAAAGYLVSRYAIEIRNCYGHDNLQGFSGPAGDSVWVHDSRFLHNSVGMATGTLAGEPGLPQNHGLFERNELGENNANYYRNVTDGSCGKPSAQRGYDTGTVCPAVGVPVGTGAYNPGGNYNAWLGNWVYGNDYAGFVTSWAPPVLHGDRSFGDQFQTSDRNRYEGNHLGVAPDGHSASNGMDFWWDGQGVASCWQQPSDAGADPAPLPQCGPDGYPHRFATTARYVADPAKLLKLYACSRFDAASGKVPGNCQWYGASGMGRVEVQWAVGEAGVLGLMLILVWWRVLRGAPGRRRGTALGMLGLLTALAGLIVNVLGTADEGSLLAPAALGLLGFGWLAFGIVLRRRRRPGLGFLTVALGVLALAGAVDSGIYMLPFVPVPPSLWRITLEAFWVAGAIVAAVHGRPLSSLARPPAPRTGDALESFTAFLRPTP